MEKSTKKPRRLLRLWKSLTYRKSLSSQTSSDANTSCSLSPGTSSITKDPFMDFTPLRWSESNNDPSVNQDIDMQTDKDITSVNSFHNTAHNFISTIQPANRYAPTAHLSMCGIQQEAAKEVIVVSAPTEPLTDVGTVHTQVDYVHYLVPDLKEIFNSSYYWGVMDRYEAEKLLETKPEGTFLLRDSAQEDFLFSVSFRRYNRSLHARIEQWEHKFSFDSHDSNVYSCKSVCGLIERYKDLSCLMFFEPLLTIPLPKTTPFSLQSLCRATLCSMLNYDDITRLPIPPSLMDFLQYYHYKQRVRVRRFWSCQPVFFQCWLTLPTFLFVIFLKL